MTHQGELAILEAHKIKQERVQQQESKEVLENADAQGLETDQSTFTDAFDTFRAQQNNPQRGTKRLEICCIRPSRDGKSYYFCCCIPVVIGIIVLTLVTVMDLIASIQIRDWISSAIYSVLTICFIVSFFKKDRAYRQLLFNAYLIMFVLTLIYVIYFCFFSGNVKGRTNEICTMVSKVLAFEDCDSTVDEYIWWFVALYLIVLVMVRLLFATVLQAWKEQGTTSVHQEYESLNGHVDNKDNQDLAN